MGNLRFEWDSGIVYVHYKIRPHDIPKNKENEERERADHQMSGYNENSVDVCACVRKKCGEEVYAIISKLL